jgi:hypothetical protein
MNENIQLLINDVSSNTKHFNCVYCFAKSSHLSSISGLKSLIDLFNGIDNPWCSVDPLILYATFHVYSHFFNFLF